MTLSAMRAIHPGEILREEFLLPLDMSVNALARALRLPPSRQHDLRREQAAHGDLIAREIP